jgi:hypothetical protein
MLIYNLNKTAMENLEKRYLELHPEDINDEIAFVSFDTPFSLASPEDMKKSFNRVVAYFGGIERAERVFNCNGIGFPTKEQIKGMQ